MRKTLEKIYWGHENGPCKCTGGREKGGIETDYPHPLEEKQLNDKINK